MQYKEKKWADIEKVMQIYIDNDEELKDKLHDLKLTVGGSKKVTNVV
jgi:hypothetical protein